MPNVTIPTTTSTQTLTGDNGFTTQATFTANALTASNFNASGVGMAGASYDPSGEAALEVAFSDAVEDVSFTIFDLDEAVGGWDDQLRVEAYDLAGNPIPITWTSTSTGHVEEIDGANGVLQIEASDLVNDDQSSIFVSIAGPVGSFKVFYEDGNTTSNDGGLMDMLDLAFTNVAPRDGTVEGTSGADTIDSTYAGDPDGDVVDNDDAILTGDTGDDDLIYGFGGNDTISAGAGADEAYGGSGDDTIDGGAANDLVVGDQTTNAAGDDTLTGGTGNDTLYGDNLPDTGETAATTTFSWAAQPPADEADISGGLTGTSANGDVTVRLEVQQEENFTSATMEKTDPLFDYNDVSDTSSVNLFGGATGAGQNAATATLTFDAAQPGFQGAVENLTFGIFDIDRAGGSFRDQVIIRAYDQDGNLIPVTLDAGNDATIDTSVPGTATAAATAGGGATNAVNGFVEVSVAGPVYRIEIDLNNIDSGLSGHDIRVGDLTFDTVPIDGAAAGGDDSLDGGIGDDTLFGGDGEDTLTASAGDDTSFGGTGSDTFAVADTTDTETITGGEDAGNGDIDGVDFTAPTSGDGVSVTYSGNEAGTYAFDSTTASGSFAQIERIDTTDFDDTIDANASTGGVSVVAGTGADTITSGQGDDRFDLGDGTPDGDADQVILTDGFGSDVIEGFDAPTPNADGTFTGIDTFDVTGLNDASAVPVNTNDVIVTDDGVGNTLLSFPNGESVTLIGIDPADADDPLYLNAIGIPLPPPDGIVTGTEGSDTIDAGYEGDLEGDRVDAGDALLAGEGPEDDIIVARGGDDRVTAGAGNDDIYGGDGSDTLDGGTGNDTIYGDTPGGAWFYEYYDLDPTGDPRTLAQAGFAQGTADFEGIPTEVGYSDTIAAAAFDTADDYALKFTTVLEVTTGGDYTFATSSDDGSKLFVNGVEIVNNDGHHGTITRTGAPLDLPPGAHVIEIIYYENNGANTLSATILGPDTGGARTDLASYDGLRPATGDDDITGGTGDDTLFGGTGSDTFNVAAAHDTDQITGGEDAGGGDTDTVNFAPVGTADGVTVSFDGDEQGTYQVGAAGSDGTFTEIERIVGTDTADSVDLTADSAGITVETGAGDDVITSGAGDDSIAGGTGQDDIVINDDFGNDTIDGGDGADGTGDVLDGSGLTQDVTVDISSPETGTVTNGGDTLSFAEIEEIRTGSGDDTVTSGGTGASVSTGAGEDDITFGDGDTIDAGGDDDTLTLGGAAIGGTITIDGGGEIRDGAGDLVGSGDVLRLGDLADFDTITKTKAADGSFSGSIQLLDGTTVNFTDIESIVCFTPGAMIATPQGARAVETLQVGDMVVTRDHGLQPIRWIQSRTVEATGKFAPVRIKPGVVTGLEKDLLVSPQHRMLFTGYRAELLFGEREVLMPALHLLDDKMVTRERGGTVTYVHMMFDSHEVIYAEGAATESFHPGEQGLSGIAGAAREELFALFPELRSDPHGYGPAARRCLKKHETQMLQV